MEFYNFVGFENVYKKRLLRILVSTVALGFCLGLQPVMISENLPAVSHDTPTEQFGLDPQPVMMATFTLEEICSSLTELQQMNSFCFPSRSDYLPSEALPFEHASNLKEPKTISGKETTEGGEVYGQSADPTEVVEVSIDSQDQAQDHAMDL